MGVKFRMKQMPCRCLQSLPALLVGVALICVIAGCTVRAAPSGPTPLVYAADRDGGLRLYTFDVDSGQERPLLRQPRPALGPAWSPDRTQMAFLILNAAINAFVINRDGSGERPLTFGVRGESPVAWSRDGGRIAFESMDTANRTQIFVFNVNGSGRIPLTTLPGDSLYPAWSPDGRRLAFLYRECTTTGDGTGHIYVANPDGTGLRRVVTEGGDIAFEADSEITWAPDGRRVVFDARSGPSIDHKTWIFAVLVDGGAPARLTPGFSLAWSPDGRRLAYVSSEDGQVTTMNADGTGRARLTPEGTLRLLMRWAPDGRRLAVVSLNPDRRDALELVLDVVNADGSGFRRLTSLALLPVTRPHAMLPIGRLLVDW